MNVINVAIPVVRGRMSLTVDKGRPWSVVEHIILEALTTKTWTAAELAAAGKLPRRIVMESCARLMRAGWAELLQDEQSVCFRATPRGKEVACHDELPNAMERRKRTASYVVDLVTNELFRGRAWVVHDEKALRSRAKTEPFVWIKALDEIDYEPNKLIDLLLDDDETFVHAEPSGPAHRWAVATVKDGIVDGLPTGAPLAALRHAVLAAAAKASSEPTTADATFSVSAPRTGISDTPEIHDISFEPSDLVLGAEAHRNTIKQAFACARTNVFVHSTFISEDHFLALLPEISGAILRGVGVHVLWGQNEDTDRVASTKVAIAKIRKNKAVTALGPLLVIHPFSTGSHAKLIVGDFGDDDKYVAVIGSCNWLASGFYSYEASVRLHDPSIVRNIAEYLARMSCLRRGVWSELATQLTSISQKLRAAKSSSPSNGYASVVIGAQHNHFVLRARDEAQHRALVLSHKLGPVSGPGILTPLMAAVRQRDINARVFYGAIRKPMNSQAANRLAVDAADIGVALNAIHHPRVHAKVVAWDDDAIAISSLNWLSADATELDSLNEIGIEITAPGAAKAFFDNFEGVLNQNGSI